MSLAGRVALVTGGSSGIGRGYALQLADAGAIVYISGRTKEPNPERPGRSLDEVADQCRERGRARVEPIKCDHSNDADIVSLFDTIERKEGQLDILVNQCFPTAVMRTAAGQGSFWELPIDMYDKISGVGLNAHYVASVLAARMMVRQHDGLIVNTTDGIQGKPKDDGTDPDNVELGVPYCLVKAALDRMTVVMAKDLRPYNVAMVGLDPGFTLTENVKGFKYKVETGDFPESERSFIETIRPMFEAQKVFYSVETAGRSVVALATDKDVMRHSGKSLHNCELSELYSFRID